MSSLHKPFSSAQFRERLRQLIEERDLIFLGVVRPDAAADFANFSAWLKEGRHGGMGFLERNQHIRADPEKILPGVRSVVVMAFPYKIGDRSKFPAIAQYARYVDYHRLLWRMGDEVMGSLFDEGYPFSWRVCVDSAPVLERALASKTARGFIGKNTCYIHPTWGSFLLLAEVFLDVPLPCDEANPIEIGERSFEHGGCGTCRRCQSHCPTGALDRDYSIDAKRCLSYWTIEHRGLIPYEYWKWIGEYLFGCDKCQSVCPYNRGVPVGLHAKQLKLEHSPDLFAMATLSQDSYARLYGGTPMTRAKREGLVRNALIAMRVSGDPRLSLAIQLMKHEIHPTITGTIEQARTFNETGQ